MQVYNSVGQVIGYTTDDDPALIKLIGYKKEIRVPIEFAKSKPLWYFLYKNEEQVRELIPMQVVIQEGETIGDDYVYKW